MLLHDYCAPLFEITEFSFEDVLTNSAVVTTTTLPATTHSGGGDLTGGHGDGTIDFTDIL